MDKILLLVEKLSDTDKRKLIQKIESTISEVDINKLFFSIVIEKGWKPTIDKEKKEEAMKNETIKRIFDEWNISDKHKIALWNYMLYWTAKFIKWKDKWRQRWETEKTFDLYRRWVTFRRDLSAPDIEQKEEVKKEAIQEKKDYYNEQEELLQKKKKAIQVFQKLSLVEQEEIRKQAFAEVKEISKIDISETLLNTLVQARINLIVQKKYL